MRYFFKEYTMSKTRKQEHIFVETRVNFYRVNITSFLNKVTAMLRSLFA